MRKRHDKITHSYFNMSIAPLYSLYLTIPILSCKGKMLKCKAYSMLCILCIHNQAYAHISCVRCQCTWLGSVGSQYFLFLQSLQNYFKGNICWIQCREGERDIHFLQKEGEEKRERKWKIFLKFFKGIKIIVFFTNYNNYNQSVLCA